MAERIYSLIDQNTMKTDVFCVCVSVCACEAFDRSASNQPECPAFDTAPTVGQLSWAGPYCCLRRLLVHHFVCRCVTNIMKG